MTDQTVLELRKVELVRDKRSILRDITWRVQARERWVVLGPNGSGKTTLCKIAGLYQHPTHGIVNVLGGRVGRVDVRSLRARVGFTSVAMSDLLNPSIRVADVVATGKYAALSPHWHQYTAEDHLRAGHLLARFGCHALSSAPFGQLSSGERQRVLLARTLMSNPALLLLDEPTAGLDVGGRERLVQLLGGLAQDPTAPAIVMVTHHVEEIPPGFTHGLLLRDGMTVGAGPIAETLTSKDLSSCFGIPLQIEHRARRWTARAV